MWVSPNLEITRAGYMPFDGGFPAAPSDGHRMLWLEVDNFSFLGKHIPTSTPPLAWQSVESNHMTQEAGEGISDWYGNNTKRTTSSK